MPKSVLKSRRKKNNTIAFGTLVTALEVLKSGHTFGYVLMVIADRVVWSVSWPGLPS